MKRAWKTGGALPFTIDRDAGTTLTRQLVEGFRQAVVSGRYRAGDMLPPIPELVRLTGVCPVVVRSALKRLAAEGLVRPRAGVGTIVLAPCAGRPLGHVAIVTPEVSDNYTVALIVGHVSSALQNAGYLVSKVAIPPGRRGRPATAAAVNLPSGTTFAMSIGRFSAEIRRALSAASVPFLAVAPYSPVRMPLCLGSITLDYLSPIPEFIAHCVGAGVGRIAQVDFFKGKKEVRDAAAAAGLECYDFPVTRRDLRGASNPVEGAMVSMRRRLAKLRGNLPDVLLCTDNCAAEGVLLALSEAGLRIPEDIRFATWMSAGDRPVYWKSLTRLEFAPGQCGDALGRIVLRALEGRPPHPGTIFRSSYIVGETFPPAPTTLPTPRP